MSWIRYKTARRLPPLYYTAVNAQLRWTLLYSLHYYDYNRLTTKQYLCKLFLLFYEPTIGDLSVNFLDLSKTFVYLHVFYTREGLGWLEVRGRRPSWMKVKLGRRPRGFASDVKVAIPTPANAFILIRTKKVSSSMVLFKKMRPSRFCDRWWNRWVAPASWFAPPSIFHYKPYLNFCLSQRLSLALADGFRAFFTGKREDIMSTKLCTKVVDIPRSNKGLLRFRFFIDSRWRTFTFFLYCRPWQFWSIQMYSDISHNGDIGYRLVTYK